MGTITLYRNDERLPLESTDSLISRAMRMISVLERFKERLDEVNASLEASEIEDVVTVRDVALVIQRAELVLRVRREIAAVLDELGEQGRLLHLQLDELSLGVGKGQLLVIEDYLLGANSLSTAEVLRRLGTISTEELMSLSRVVVALSPQDTMLGLEDSIEARGIRLLRQVTQVPSELVERLVAHFGSLHTLVRAPLGAFVEATGMSEADAAVIKAEIARLAQSKLAGRSD
jgi:diadenylate cyclase